MTTIFERVVTALETLSPAVPYALERMLSSSSTALPDVYLVYNLVSDTPAGHHDDQETARGYLVQVSIFKRGGLLNLPDVESAMLAQGFTKGQRRQLPTDTQSGHYHLALDFRFHEENLP